MLTNGLRLLFAPDASLDDVTIVVRYDVGLSDDPAGKDGLAHLVEHLMFDGSRHVPRGQYYGEIERAGGWAVNARTTLDDTRYFVTVPPEALALVFWLESDRMGFLDGQIDERSLDHERQTVTYEVRDRVFDRGLGTVGGVALGEVFPPWHPYHRDLDPQWLPDITVADVRAYLRTWYTPSNATLVVAGRFDPVAALALSEKYFGDLPTHSPPTRPSWPSKWMARDVQVDMGAGMSRDSVVLGWPAPALGQPGDAELDLAAAILSDPEGRLQRDLVLGGWASRVASAERSYRRGSTFIVEATVAPERSPADVARRIEEAIRQIGESVTDAECARARVEWADGMLLRMETSAGRAQWLAGAPSLRTPWDATKYDGFGPGDVARAVREELGSGNRTVLIVHHGARYPPRGIVLNRQEQDRQEQDR